MGCMASDSRLKLFGHNLIVERLWQRKHRDPFELRIRTYATGTVQPEDDEEHVLLDSPCADLTELRIKHHHLFCILRERLSSNPSRLRGFVSRADTKCLALYVHECMECCA